MYVRVALAVALCLLILNVIVSRRYPELSQRLRGDPYVLDAIPRVLPAGVTATCPGSVSHIEYRGDIVPYATPLQVAPSFVPRLAAFERILAQLANERYGRAPEHILHLGARACRSIRGRPDRLSEHALGNALDVSGFQFGRAPELETKAPPSLKDAFTITVRQHWPASVFMLSTNLHGRFLRELVDRLIAARVFRGVIGPGREGHADHLHFDQGPWTYTSL